MVSSPFFVGEHERALFGLGVRYREIEDDIGYCVYIRFAEAMASEISLRMAHLAGEVFRPVLMRSFHRLRGLSALSSRIPFTHQPPSTQLRQS